MHIYQDADTSKEKNLTHLFCYPFMETKQNCPTTSKTKSWKGNLVDDNGGTDKYAYQNRRYIVANTHSWIFSTWLCFKDIFKFMRIER